MMYTIRNLAERTKTRINSFADEHNLTVAEAIEQLTEFGLEYFEQQRKNPKRFRNLSEALAEYPGGQP